MQDLLCILSVTTGFSKICLLPMASTASKKDSQEKKRIWDGMCILLKNDFFVFVKAKNKQKTQTKDSRKISDLVWY